jgi:predicted NAD/FAD-binding protein
MRMLGFFAPGAWRKPSGGFVSYLKAIEEELGTQVRLGTKARKVRRRGDGKLEVDLPGAIETFDKVVLATSADLALRLLENPTSRHQKALGGFAYVDVVAVLHDDETILENPAGGEYCEYLREAGNGDDQPYTAQLTRINNNLPGHGGVRRPLLVTIDPKRPIAEGAVLAEKRWRLPKLRPTDFCNKKKFHTIQGLWDLWYCGLDTSLTGHEGAIVSGMVIAEQLGGRYPFPEGSAAHSHFLAIRKLMGFSPEPRSPDFNATTVVPGI